MPSRFQHIDVIDDRVAEILRQKTDGERLAMVDQMWCFARDMIRVNLRRDQAIPASPTSRSGHSGCS
jgi:hypothetical protein